MYDMNFFEPLKDTPGEGKNWSTFDGSYAYSGNTEGSYLELEGSVGVSAAIGFSIKSTVELSFCIVQDCFGLGVKGFFDTKAGMDIGLTTTEVREEVGGAAGCDENSDDIKEFALMSRWTRFAEYTSKNLQTVEDGRVAANGGLLFAGGAWLYATTPFVKLYGIYDSEYELEVTAAN